MTSNTKTTLSLWERDAIAGLAMCLYGRRIFCSRKTFEKIIEDAYLRIVTERDAINRMSSVINKSLFEVGYERQ